MSKYLIALAIAGAMTVPAGAQTMPTNQTVPNPAQQTKPPMVKKIVCEDNDNPYSNIRRVCRTTMVPATPTATSKQAAPNQPQAAD